MKCQALRPQFFSVGGWGVVGLVRWVGSGDGGTHSVDMRPCGCFIYYFIEI